MDRTTLLRGIGDFGMFDKIDPNVKFKTHGLAPANTFDGKTFVYRLHDDGTPPLTHLISARKPRSSSVIRLS